MAEQLVAAPAFPVGTPVRAPGGMTGKVIRVSPTLKHSVLVQLDNGIALAYLPGELTRIVPPAAPWPCGPQ